METSLTASELRHYVDRQLANFFPDGRGELAGPAAESALSLALERCESCFSEVTLYRRDGRTVFDHLHGDQYAAFLYFLANSLWGLSENKMVCDKLLQLNRALHGFFLSYKCEMPRVFLLDHPVGAVLGNAVYADYLVVLQNVTVNTQDKLGEQPRFGKRVYLSAGAKIIGSPVIGHNVVIGAGTVVNNVDIPGGSVAYTDRGSGGLHVRPYDSARIFSGLFRS